MAVLSIPFWPRRTLRILVARTRYGVQIRVSVLVSSVSRRQLEPVNAYLRSDGMDPRKTLPVRGVVIVDEEASTEADRAQFDAWDIDEEIEARRAGVLLPGMGVPR